MKKIMLSALICISACTFNSNYNMTLNQWLNHSEYELISEWGEPDKIIYIDANSYVYVYEKISDVPFDNERNPYQNELNYQALGGIKYGESQIEQIYYCKTLFTIENNIVTDYSFIGDDCV